MLRPLENPHQAWHTKGTLAGMMEGLLLRYYQSSNLKEDREGRPEDEMQLCTIPNHYSVRL